MGRDKSGKPLQQPDGLTAASDPVEVHGRQVDAGGLDVASLLHQVAKTVCEKLGVPCGCQGNLPNGECIATSEPCRYARAVDRPDGCSGRPFAADAQAKAKPSGK